MSPGFTTSPDVGIDWPDSFFPLPGIAGAVARDEARPCKKCGAMDFLIVETALKTASVQCPACCKLKPGDRVIGVLDRRVWVVRPAPRERR